MVISCGRPPLALDQKSLEILQLKIVLGETFQLNSITFVDNLRPHDFVQNNLQWRFILISDNMTKRA